jgi:uncharacterized lipoprotein YddW (UPF0748 family)
VVEHVASVGRDLVTRYYLDGLHLDNVRYAGWEYSQDPITLDRVAEARATEPGVDRKEWQRRQVNLLVGRLHQAINDVKPGLLLSAAVWPIYKDVWDWWEAGDGYSGYCQDSVSWLRSRIADAICPMLYLSSITKDDEQFDQLVRDFVARAQGYPIYAGITTTYADFAKIGKRIDLAREAGAEGQAIFAFGHINQRNYWDEFKAGPYATPALLLPPEAVRTRVSLRLRAETAVKASPTAPAAPE